MSRMREQLAKLAHDQWSGWMGYLFSKTISYKPGAVQAEEGALIIPKWAVDRWQKQAKTLYSELTPTEMDSDRKEADKFIALLEYKPEPGEFTKEVKEYLTTWINIANTRTVEYDEMLEFVGQCGDYLKEACDHIDRLSAENDKMTDMLMAAGFLGQGTQLIGDKRYKELLKAEADLKAKDEEIERLRDAIVAAIRIKDLWTLKEVETLFEDEAKALDAMLKRFEQALKGV